MNLIFKNIKLHNFLSMGDAELDLDNNGYVLVSGINNNKADLAQSNGSGKCFGAGTKILMFDGTEKSVEDIVVGDIVMGDDSTPRTVMEIHSGESELYKISSTKNNNYSYICNGKHILNLYRTCDIRESTPIEVQISVEDCLKKPFSFTRYYNQKITDGVVFNNNYSLLIEPYMLGIWLGDGTSKNSSIYSADDEVIKYIKEYSETHNLHLVERKKKKRNGGFQLGSQYTFSGEILDNGKRGKNTFLKNIRKLGLYGNKHIPEEYLTASTEDRLELLAGILDSDGDLSKRKKTNGNFGEHSFCTVQKNKVLAEHIVKLSRLLGFRTTISEKIGRAYIDGVPTSEGKYYRIYISGELWKIPTRVKRKQAEIYKAQRPHTLVPKISKIGFGNYYGFSTDGNHKFLLADGTIVHNSSCFEGIFYALTGETIRGSKDVKNIHTEDGCVVDLSFEMDGKDFRILRSKDSKQWKTTVKLWVDGKDMSGKGVRDTNALIQQYLPDLNSNLIGSVIIMGQGLPHRFSNNTPSGRKEVLEKLSKSDFMIEDLKNKISARKSFLQTELRKYEDLVLADTSKQRVLTSQKEKAELELSSVKLEDLQRFTEDKKRLEDEITQLEYEVSVLDEKPLSDELEICNNSLRELSKDKWDAMNMVDKNHEQEISLLASEIQKLQTSATLLLSEIKRNDAVRDTCPTCGQKLVGVHKIDTTEQKLQYKDAVESMTRKQDELKIVKDKIIIEKTSILEKFAEDEERLTAQADGIKSKIDKIRQDKNSLSRNIMSKKADLHSVELNISKFDSNIEALKRTVAETIKQIEELSEKILYNSNERDKVNEHLSVVNKFNTVITRDFRGVLLEDIIKYIETKSKEYSQIVFGTENVKFVLDGNNIRIIYDEKDYENLSGGEKQKIDLIVQLAIRDMLCKYLNLSVNIMVADEVFDNVDSVGCQNILTLLSESLKDVNSTYIITHHANDLAIPYDKEIIVIKNENGISGIKV